MDLESLFRKPGLIIAVVVVLLGVTGAFVATTSIQDSHAAAAADMLFQARKALEKEEKALVATLPKPEAAPAAKPTGKSSKADSAKAQAKADEKAKEKEEEKGDEKAEETAAFMKVDVAAKFPEAVKAFQAVIDKYPGTRAAFEARLAMGSLYFDHGDAVQAQNLFQLAADNAPKATDKAAALQSVGYALENQGKLTDALEAYKKALSQNDAELKGDLDAAIARCSGNPTAASAGSSEKSNIE
jgi:tetratricopeptide (TPR) repeat protein